MLYRILMRFAVVVLIATFALIIVVIAASGGADFSHANWLAILAFLFVPAGLIAALAWVFKPRAGR